MYFVRRCMFCLLLYSIQNGRVSAMQTNNKISIDNPVAGVGLTLIDARAPNFRDEVSKFLDSDVMTKASPFLPSSLVVVNGTERHIYGFTVIYTYPNRRAAAGTPWQYRVSPTAGRPDDQRTMIGPGGRYLITPVAGFQASRDVGGRRTLLPYVDEGMERMINLYAANDANEPVTVLVDSVIFDDGTIVGPDTADRMGKVNAQMRAEKDLVAGVNGLHGEALRKQLVTYSEARSTEREYSNRQNIMAGYFLNVLKSRGESAALQAVSDLSSVRWFANNEGVTRKGQ